MLDSGHTAEAEGQECPMQDIHRTIKSGLGGDLPPQPVYPRPLCQASHPPPHHMPWSPALAPTASAELSSLVCSVSSRPRADPTTASIT